MSKKTTENQSLNDLRIKAAKLTLDIAAGREKNTSAVKIIKKQVARLLTANK